MFPYERSATREWLRRTMVEALLTVDKVCAYDGVDARCDCKKIERPRRDGGENTGCYENRQLATMARRFLQTLDDLGKVTVERDEAETKARALEIAVESLKAEVHELTAKPATKFYNGSKYRVCTNCDGLGNLAGIGSCDVCEGKGSTIPKVDGTCGGCE